MEAAMDTPTPQTGQYGDTSELRRLAEEAQLNAEAASAELANAVEAFQETCRVGVLQILEDPVAAAAAKPRRQPSEEEAEMKHVLIDGMFQKLDVDGSGVLDRGEILLLFQGLQLDLTLEQQAVVFKRIDADGSGEISFEEFFAWFLTI